MTYILNRLLSIALTLFLISVITFAVTTILPGDVATMIMGTQSNPEALAGLRKSLGLNDPLIVQYGRWIGGMVTGDWGHSLVFKVPIADLLIQKIKASSLIVVMSMAIALTCAVPLGVWAAVHRDRWQDGASSSAALVGVSLPDFFWGIMMILLFARTLGWFPSSGFADPVSEPRAGAGPRLPAVARPRARAHGASDAHDPLDHDRHSRTGISFASGARRVSRSEQSFGVTRWLTRSAQ